MSLSSRQLHLPGLLVTALNTAVYVKISECDFTVTTVAVLLVAILKPSDALHISSPPVGSAQHSDISMMAAYDHAPTGILMLLL